jgi:hypothetical protein
VPQKRRRSTTTFACPSCFEEVDVYVDPGGGTHQDFIEDCPVCCRPNRIMATYSEELGDYEITAEGAT